MRNKLMLFVLLLLLSVQCVCADAENDAMTLYEQFPQMKYNRNYTDRKNGQKYYRFPSKVTFFEPIDLKYFPHETWNVSDWSLLSRRENALTYNQMIVLDAPAQSIMAHGTAVGADYGFLSDFYLLMSNIYQSHFDFLNLEDIKYYHYQIYATLYQFF